MIESLLVHDVTVTHPVVSTDRNGARREAWSGATTSTAKGWLHQTSSSEPIEGRDGELSLWVLYLPAGTDVDAHDRVTVLGLTFEVDAPPLPAWTPRGEHHLEVRLRRMVG